MLAGMSTAFFGYIRFAKIIFSLVVVLSATSFAAQQTIDYAFVAPESCEAEFRLRLPDAKPIKYVLVLVPGSDGDGRGMVNDAGWRQFAEEHHCAIVACRLVVKDNVPTYMRVEDWSGAALFAALKHFSEQTKKPELATVPLLMWGYSAGGCYSYNIANWRPERVAGFVLVKAALNTDEACAAMLKIPALFIGGETDHGHTDLVASRYASARWRGALWCLAVEAGSGHEVGQSAVLGRAFLRDVIARRAAVASTGSADVSWLGDSDTFEIFANGEKKSADTTWLPSEAFAKAWQAFVGGKK